MQLPSVVRLATISDEPAIIYLLDLMHQESGLFALSKEKVRECVQTMLEAPRNSSGIPSIVGVIGTPTDLQATIGITLTQPWYSDQWHCTDIWNFVRPDSRRSTHAKELLEFGKRMSGSLGLKFISGVTSNVRTEAKMRLYRRRFGVSVGGCFLYDPAMANA